VVLERKILKLSEQAGLRVEDDSLPDARLQACVIQHHALVCELQQKAGSGNRHDCRAGVRSELIR
jgi:hypothetical protein